MGWAFHCVQDPTGIAPVGPLTCSLIQSQAIILHPMALDPATCIFPQWWYLELRAGEAEKEGSLGLTDQIPQVSETPTSKRTG